MSEDVRSIRYAAAREVLEAIVSRLPAPNHVTELVDTLLKVGELTLAVETLADLVIHGEALSHRADAQLRGLLRELGLAAQYEAWLPPPQK